MSKEIISVHQAQHDPIESFEKLDEFINAIGGVPQWKECGVLTDESANNQLIVLLSDGLRVSLRLNLIFSELKVALQKLGIGNDVHVRHMQGKHLEKKDLASMEAVLAVWNKYHAQSMDIPIKHFPAFLRAIWENRKHKGRGKSFSKGTLEQLARDSHGYCMFEGCGESLVIDKLTGYSGNFAYNAHIIASSSRPCSDSRHTVSYITIIRFRDNMPADWP